MSSFCESPESLSLNRQNVRVERITAAEVAGYSPVRFVKFAQVRIVLVRASARSASFQRHRAVSLVPEWG